MFQLYTPQYSPYFDPILVPGSDQEEDDPLGLPFAMGQGALTPPQTGTGTGTGNGAGDGSGSGAGGGANAGQGGGGTGTAPGGDTGTGTGAGTGDIGGGTTGSGGTSGGGGGTTTGGGTAPVGPDGTTPGGWTGTGSYGAPTPYGGWTGSWEELSKIMFPPDVGHASEAPAGTPDVPEEWEYVNGPDIWVPKGTAPGQIGGNPTTTSPGQYKTLQGAPPAPDYPLDGTHDQAKFDEYWRWWEKYHVKVGADGYGGPGTNPNPAPIDQNPVYQSGGGSDSGSADGGGGSGEPVPVAPGYSGGWIWSDGSIRSSDKPNATNYSLNPGTDVQATVTSTDPTYGGNTPAPSSAPNSPADSTITPSTSGVTYNAPQPVAHSSGSFGGSDWLGVAGNLAGGAVGSGGNSTANGALPTPQGQAPSGGSTAGVFDTLNPWTAATDAIDGFGLNDQTFIAASYAVNPIFGAAMDTMIGSEVDHRANNWNLFVEGTNTLDQQHNLGAQYPEFMNDYVAHYQNMLTGGPNAEMNTPYWTREDSITHFAEKMKAEGKTYAMPDLGLFTDKYQEGGALYQNNWQNYDQTINPYAGLVPSW